MLSAILDGELMVSRVRPARRPRWRRYIPGAALAIFAILPAWAPDAAIDPLAAAGLGPHAARVALAAVPILVGMLASALVDHDPVPVLIVGTLGASLGGNLFAGPLVASPLALFGIGWLAFVETRRLFEGITLAPAGLTIHRALRDPLELDWDDIRAVHTSLSTGDAGTLILETEHGTVTAQALPHCEELQARMEARMTSTGTRATVESLEQAGQRVQALLSGEGSST